MRLTLTTFTTLDGVMQAPGAIDEDPSGGFRFGGWLTPFANEETGRVITGIFQEADALLLGRTTYDMMQRFWSRVSDPNNVVATALNTLPKYVVTSKPETLTWKGSQAVRGNVVDAARELKKLAGRELQVHGSYQVAQALIRAGLVDQFNVWTFPVVVGRGKRLFEASSDLAVAMKLLASEVLGTGVIIARYEPAGAPSQQSFAVVDGKVDAR